MVSVGAPSHSLVTMHMSINEPRGDNPVFYVENIRSTIRGNVFSDGRNLAVLHRDIERAVQSLTRIDHSPSLNQQIETLVRALLGGLRNTTGGHRLTAGLRKQCGPAGHQTLGKFSSC